MRSELRPNPVSVSDPQSPTGFIFPIVSSCRRVDFDRSETWASEARSPARLLLELLQNGSRPKDLSYFASLERVSKPVTAGHRLRKLPAWRSRDRHGADPVLHKRLGNRWKSFELSVTGPGPAARYRPAGSRSPSAPRKAPRQASPDVPARSAPARPRLLRRSGTYP